MGEKGKIALSVIAVGGNSEVRLAASESGHTLRELTREANGGELGKILLSRFAPWETAGAEIDCTYYSWTGTPRDDVGPAWKTFRQNLTGEKLIYRAEHARKRGGPLIVVGWSNGGDTAYKLADMLGSAVDLLITLDPVSRLTSSHWLPFNGDFEPRPGLRWLHAYTTSWGHSRKRADDGGTPDSLFTLSELWFRGRNAFYEMPNPLRWFDSDSPHSGNLIAFIGGAWDSQKYAKENIAVAGNHGDTTKMLGAIVGSGGYAEFMQMVRVKAGLR